MPIASDQDMIKGYRIETRSGKVYSVLSDSTGGREFWKTILEYRKKDDPGFEFTCNTPDNKVYAKILDANEVIGVDETNIPFSMKDQARVAQVAQSKQVSPVKIHSTKIGQQAVRRK